MVPGLRRNKTGQKREKSAFREYAESIIFAVVLALILRQFVVQAFKIPSGSMEDTLLIGDHILVNKFLYHFTDPKQFDVIVFRYPWDEERDFIKRVIALPRRPGGSAQPAGLRERRGAGAGMVSARDGLPGARELRADRRAARRGTRSKSGKTATST